MIVEEKNFDVLDRSLNVRDHYVLEASAGTGKTFSIENVVVRMLVDKTETPNLEQILVMTFTRAATRELKGRIRQKIGTSIEILKKDGNKDSDPDYLLAIIEEGPEAKEKAIRALERALASYDEAQIFTIHGFCQRMLSDYGEKGNSFFSECRWQGVLPTEAARIIKDFFRTQVKKEKYSKEQIKILFKENRQDIDLLIRSLIRIIDKKIPIAEEEDFSSLYEKFQLAMKDFLSSIDFSQEMFLKDFVLLAQQYTKTCNRQGDLLPSIKAKAERFAAFLEKKSFSTEDFDALISDGLVVLDALDPLRKKARAKNPENLAFSWEEIIEKIKSFLQPIVSKARSYPHLLSRMAFDSKKLFENVVDAKELYGPDDLLEKMEKATEEEVFVDQVQKRYRCVIVDEFQDTDPRQWRILQRLFFSSEKDLGIYLYLVGDPKQSIYAFRNADIYTYLQAAWQLGADKRCSLNVNYRSEQLLVEALNALFSAEKIKDFFPLPKEKTSLSYPMVKAFHQQQNSFKDQNALLRFFVAKENPSSRRGRVPSDQAESSQLFPFIAKEIFSLHKKENIPLEDIALLVRDRYQGLRLAKFLRKKGFLVAMPSRQTLVDTPTFIAMQQLLRAILHPRDITALKTALGTHIIGWDYQQVSLFQQQYLQDPALCEDIIAQFFSLRTTLYQQGFAACFHQLMHSSWREDGGTLEENLLQQKGGLDLYTDCFHLAELLVEYQTQTKWMGEGLMHFFAKMKKLCLDNDERVVLRRSSTKEALPIITLHASKGLEYSVVFALGLANRTPVKDLLMPKNYAEGPVLAAIEDPIDYEKYCEENDAEKMRQLYVAMTRAKRRLYVPIVTGCQKKPEKGSASPIELFLGRWNTQDLSYQDLYERMGEEDVKRLKDFVEEKNDVFSIDYIEIDDENIELPFLEKESNTPELFPPEKIVVPGKDLRKLSFSSLAKKKQRIERIAKEDLAFPEEHSVHSLPRGASIGTLLHNILEAIPWNFLQQVKNPQEVLVLINAYYREPFPKEVPKDEWLPTIAEMVFTAFTIPLNDGKERFSLQQVAAEKVFREMEFLFAIEEKGHLLNGFVDLFFEYKEEYYLLDWKSNWLGPNSSFYTKENIEEGMEEHSYPLQAALYSEAINRYLLHFPEKKEVKGAFYLFLRGLDNQGSYYFSPKKMPRIYEEENGRVVFE